MLTFGLPLIPTAIAVWGVALADRSLLTKLAPGSGAAKLAASGEYALANRFAGIVGFCTTAFVLAYEPFQLSLWREDADAERAVRARVLPYVAILFVSAARPAVAVRTRARRELCRLATARPTAPSACWR